MNPRVKQHLQQGAAVLGILAVGGGVYLMSSGGSFQADLLAQNTGSVPLVNSNDNQNGALETSTQSLSGVFDATPTASLPEISSGMTMSGLTMSGIVLPTVTSAVADNMNSEVTALENLRPAASDQADTLIAALGFSNTNSNQENSNASEVASAVSTTAPVVTDANVNLNTNTDTAAQTALQSAPRVPQTGPESWLLIVSIMCAMMGMMVLLTAPRHI